MDSLRHSILVGLALPHTLAFKQHFMLRFTSFTQRRTASGKETMRKKNANKAPVKSRHVDLRVDQASYDRIEAVARAANLSISEYIRQMLFKGKVTVKAEQVIDSADIKRALAELGRIGSNINQIARHYNGGGVRSKEMYEHTTHALSDLYDLKREVQRLGGERFGGT